MSIDSTRLPRWVQTFMNAGMQEHTDIEAGRRILVLNLFALVGFSITLILGLRALFSGSFYLAFALLIAFALFLSAHLSMRLRPGEGSYRFAATLVQGVLFVLCLYLVYSGGANGTGPLWIYLLPPVVMFLSGLRRGLVLTGFFVVGYLLLVFTPYDAIGTEPYSYEFKSRLLYSFLTLTFLAGVYEHSRRSSYRKLDELKKEFELQATQDTLTHLLNRRGLRERITYESERSQRNRTPMSFIIADVDHFKRINDEYGHDTGDAVLIQISQILQSSIRKQDSLARWGGEEFLMLLPETTVEQATQLAEKIRIKVEQFTFGHTQVELTSSMSFGVAEVYDFTQPRLAISIADKRLYMAKALGRNQVVGESR